MKLFPELGACWGGAVLSPAAAADLPQTEEPEGQGHSNRHRASRRLVKVRLSGGAAAHWKPKLNVISEDSPTPVLDRSSTGANRPTAGVDRRKPAKVKPRSPAKASRVEDYWKSSQGMALPAFSPTSFLF